jgi:hypothetical protein
MKKNFSFNTDKYKMMFVFISDCHDNGRCKPGNEKNIADNTISTDAKLVPVSEASLPDAPGADAFRMNCMICHSERYIQMQPEFPRKTWEKIVDKMIKELRCTHRRFYQPNHCGLSHNDQGKKIRWDVLCHQISISKIILLFFTACYLSILSFPGK